MTHKAPDGTKWKTYTLGNVMHIAFRRDGESLWKPLCDRIGGCVVANETVPGNGLLMHVECAREAERRGWI